MATQQSQITTKRPYNVGDYNDEPVPIVTIVLMAVIDFHFTIVISIGLLVDFLVRSIYLRPSTGIFLMSRAHYQVSPRLQHRCT